MAGVWVFDKKGVARLIRNPTRESFELKEPTGHPSKGGGSATAPGARPRVLVYIPTNQVIKSYAELEERLTELGWSRFNNPAAHHHHNSSNMIQFHRSDDSLHLISLPKSFDNFKPLHMYDIVVKNRSFFQVRDPSCVAS